MLPFYALVDVLYHCTSRSVIFHDCRVAGIKLATLHVAEEMRRLDCMHGRRPTGCYSTSTEQSLQQTSRSMCCHPSEATRCGTMATSYLVVSAYKHVPSFALGFPKMLRQTVSGMQDVTIWAIKDVRELNVLDDSLEATARSARSAAFATAAACIAATQDKEGLFANPLKSPGKTANPAGTCPGTPEVYTNLIFINPE